MNNRYHITFSVSDLLFVLGRILKMSPQDSCPLVVQLNMNLGTVFGDVIKATTQLTVHREMNLDYQGGYNVITYAARSRRERCFRKEAGETGSIRGIQLIARRGPHVKHQKEYRQPLRTKTNLQLIASKETEAHSHGHKGMDSTKPE